MIRTGRLLEEWALCRSLALATALAVTAACGPASFTQPVGVEPRIATAPAATPSESPAPGEHRIGVRLVDGVGEFYDRKTGDRFVPRGANYIRLATQLEGGRSIFYVSAFNTDAYDPRRAEATLADLHSLGYNVVRVFLNHCCTTGLSDPSGALSISSKRCSGQPGVLP